MTNQELRQKSLELCWAIEELPASEQQTKISLMASELSSQLARQLEHMEELNKVVDVLDVNINKLKELISEDSEIQDLSNVIKDYYSRDIINPPLYKEFINFYKNWKEYPDKLLEFCVKKLKEE